MRKLISSWFARRPGPPASGAADPEEIPRYPPFARGLPAVPAHRLLESHGELLGKIRLAVGLPDPDYRRIVAPVIERYAGFVHLLPASQAHHHRGAGGLLAHGLEVAYHALSGAEDVLFTAREEPGRRRELEPRWRVAAALAGLAHDLGKPVAGLSVTDREGARSWRPYRQDIVEWAREEGVDRYFLHWRAGRHRTHEVMASLVMERIFTGECKDWLAAYSDQILEAMLCAIMAPERSALLGPLVLKADNASVEIDLRRHGNVGEESWGVPVERYVMDAMRRLVAGRWSVNRPGARVWLFEEGLHVVWRQAAEEIVELLRGDRVPGVPRDADTLADILISRGLAIPRETQEGSYRYWPMSPAVLAKGDQEVRLLMLRLSSPQLLFDEPPAPVAAAVLEAGTRVPEQRGGGKPPKRNRSAPVPGLAPGPADAAPSKSAPEGNVRPDRPPPDSEGESLPASPGAAEAGPAPGPGAASRSVSAPSAVPIAPAPGQPVPEEPGPPPAEEGGPEDPLVALAAVARWEQSMFWRPPHVVVAYPEAFAAAGDPAALLAALDAAGALARDPLRPKARLRRHQDVEGAVLTAPASAILRDAARPGQDGGSEPAPPSSGQRRPRKPDREAPDVIAEDLVRRIRARDAEIPGGVTESGEGLAVRQMVLGWFAARHQVPAGDLRAALARRGDVVLLGSVRMRVKKDVGPV